MGSRGFAPFALLCTFAAGAFPAEQPEALKIVVAEGDGALNNADAGRAKEPVVYVKDAANRPVASATVTFIAPEVGPGGRFGNGSATFTTTTDAEGRAIGRGFRPNRAAGPFAIRVVASLRDSRATAAVRQTNVLPTGSSRSGKKRLALIAILGATALGGALAAAGGGGNSATGGVSGAVASPPVQSAVLAPGTPSIGAP